MATKPAVTERLDWAAHTPGPWAVDCSHIYAPDGAIIAVVHNPGSKASDYPLVANRDLMAAAPMLLEAAQDTADALKLLRIGLAHEPKAVEVIDAHLDELQFAIAHATGAA